MYWVWEWVAAEVKKESGDGCRGRAEVGVEGERRWV